MRGRAGRGGAAPPSPADTIIGIDYAFRSPPTISPGPHRFVFVNAGAVDHELNMALLRRGVTLGQAFEMAKAGRDRTDLVDEWIGVLPARAGTSALGVFALTLLPGREYVLICQLSNDVKSPQHLTLGMFGSIRVRTAK